MDMELIAVEFIKTLDVEDRKRMKVMLSHGIECGAGFANEHGVDVKELDDALLRILGGGR